MTDYYKEVRTILHLFFYCGMRMQAQVIKLLKINFTNYIRPALPTI